MVSLHSNRNSKKCPNTNIWVNEFSVKVLNLAISLLSVKDSASKKLNASRRISSLLCAIQRPFAVFFFFMFFFYLIIYLLKISVSSAPLPPISLLGLPTGQGTLLFSLWMNKNNNVFMMTLLTLASKERSAQLSLCDDRLQIQVLSKLMMMGVFTKKKMISFWWCRRI